ncbi:ABC transporter permease subunit [Cytobacillus sp. FJAT-54145]|uniref:ABC transporter permease subunit n=1 Tax=Cytobacillus spartinae TaxID=3299023 RepID=A0ABW6KF55_9BACI
MKIFLKQIRNILLLASVALVLICLAVIPKNPAITTSTLNLSYIWYSFKTILIDLVSLEGLGKTVRETYVITEVNMFFLRSLKIILPSFFLTLVVGILLGIVSFRFQRNFIGKAIQSVHLFISSLPDFFAFILIQYGLLLAVRFGFPHLDLFGHEDWYNTILPITSLSLYPIFYIYRVTASSLEDEYIKDYVSTVRAKGKSETYILFTHLLWNTWGRIITNTKTIMLYILTSLPIIELLSYYQGMGYHLLKSIQNDEAMMIIGFIYPYLLIMFIVMFISDFGSTILVPLSAENKALKPIKVRHYKKYFVWFVTRIVNIFIFIRQYPLLIFSSLIIVSLFYIAYFGPNWSFVDADLETFLFTKDDNG